MVSSDYKFSIKNKCHKNRKNSLNVEFYNTLVFIWCVPFSTLSLSNLKNMVNIWVQTLYSSKRIFLTYGAYLYVIKACVASSNYMFLS